MTKKFLETKNDYIDRLEKKIINLEVKEQETEDTKKSNLVLMRENTAIAKDNSRLESEVKDLAGYKTDTLVKVKKFESEKGVLVKQQEAELSELELHFAKEKQTGLKQAVKDTTALLVANATVEAQEDELEHLKKAIKTYQKMPELTKMIENLQELTTPSIDKLLKIMESNKDYDFKAMEDRVLARIDDTARQTGDDIRFCSGRNNNNF